MNSYKSKAVNLYITNPLGTVKIRFRNSQYSTSDQKEIDFLNDYMKSHSSVSLVEASKEKVESSKKKK